MKRILPAFLLLSTLPAEAAPAISLRSEADPGDAQSRRFQVRLERSAPVTLTCVQDGNPAEEHRVARAAATDHAITVRGLLASARYTCAAEAIDTTRASIRSAPVSFITAPLPLDLQSPKISVASANLPETGYTLYNYGRVRGFFRLSSNYLVILDAQGNVRWYLPGPGAGDIDATYLGNDRIAYGGASAAYHAPTIVGLDKTVQFVGTNAPAVPYESVGSFNHDAGVSADGSSFFTFNYTQNEGTWTGFVLKQIDIATNQVVWSWDSFADGVGNGALPAGSSADTDPYHANSVVDRWEDDGRLYLYVNMRSRYQTIKIDYETKEVVWALGFGGDFELLEPDGTPAAISRWFSNEHDAKMVGDTFVVYDNGTDDRKWLGATPKSRALRLELDEEAMTARIAFEWSEPNWVEPIWGGHDLLPNGNSLVAIGHCPTCGTPVRTSALVEIDPTGKVVWRADFRSDTETTYRTDRIDGCAIFDNRQYCPR